MPTEFGGNETATSIALSMLPQPYHYLALVNSLITLYDHPISSFKNYEVLFFTHSENKFVYQYSAKLSMRLTSIFKVKYLKFLAFTITP